MSPCVRVSSRFLEHSVDDRAQALTLPHLLFGKIFDPFSDFDLLRLTHTRSMVRNGKILDLF